MRVVHKGRVVFGHGDNFHRIYNNCFKCSIPIEVGKTIDLEIISETGTENVKICKECSIDILISGNYNEFSVIL